MSLRRVQVSEFRCLQSTEIEFDPHFTLISGPNASGKTSLLEAVHVLSRGRSFRTRQLSHLIRSRAERFVVFGETEISGRRVALGVEGSSKGVRARMNGVRVKSLAEIAAVLPVQVIDPEVHRLIEEGPSRRRRFLDWGVFHVEPLFVERWQRYQQALQQRNAALKARLPRASVALWDIELLKLGDYIGEARSSYLAELSKPAIGMARNLLGMELSLSYRAGWPKESTFAEALAASVGHDQESGVTQVGPHRAEIGIRLDGVPVKDRISRGQQKLLAATLLMAQLSLYPQGTGLRPTLLLDDPAAELDGDRLLKLIREVSQQAVQLVVTSLNREFSAFGTPGRRYSLDGGRLSAD